jgi:NAD(P)-dependent dehydrogenase (short-subunit alcohol dehydrogenase family)
MIPYDHGHNMVEKGKGSIHMKVALVTGGGRGIGRAVTARLQADGFSVVFCDNDDPAGREAAAALGGACRFAHADVGREDDVRSLLDSVRDIEGRLDLLVNNAAISRGKPLADLALADWNAVLAVNLTGPYLCARHAAGLLRASGGSIVNIASTRAFMSEANTEAYSASKGGLVALTHALAASLGPEVRVNCISPGWIDTRAWQPADASDPPALTPADHAQHPCGRVGTPEDVAALVSFLADARNAFITGANLMVDGGMTRKMIYV